MVCWEAILLQNRILHSIVQCTYSLFETIIRQRFCILYNRGHDYDCYAELKCLCWLIGHFALAFWCILIKDLSFKIWNHVCFVWTIHVDWTDKPWRVNNWDLSVECRVAVIILPPEQGLEHIRWLIRFYMYIHVVNF